uniref:RING-type E3 ubiquitin transferase n=1 Tax=Branchiostoma floridae TaxID=7739 RepID=C3YAP6_BRAFL|eukprot:XP_002606784.1 hypothetical protein BRAFLDRAFT_82426 [Branchiostoma floridae]
MEAGPSITDRHRILEDFLSCGICFEPFTKPKALPCQHSFCLRCLESQHKQWLQDCRRTSHRQQQPFRCSTCREPVSVPSTGVKGLPDNHLVANLCEEFSKKAQVGEQKDTCGFHPTESVILFCQQCEVPVCSACIGQAHSGHRVTGIKQAARKIRANIRSQLNNGRQKMETFSAFLKKIQDVQQRLTGNTTQTQQEINKAFEVQVQKLQEQRDGLLSTVEKSHHDNMTALTGQRNIVLTQLTELSRVCEDTDKLAEQEDTVSLTQGLKLAQELAKFENTQTPEICEIKHCHFEPKRSSALIELGTVTSNSMSDKQALVQLRNTNTGQVSSPNVRPIRVGQPWVRKVRIERKAPQQGGVVVSQDNELYIADLQDCKIEVFTMDGVHIREIRILKPGKSSNSSHVEPRDVAIDKDGNLWVVTWDRVIQFSKEGARLTRIDVSHGNNCYYRGITVTKETEQVIVTDDPNFHRDGRLLVYNQDGSEVGTYCSGHRSPYPWYPLNVTVDGEGNILVTDGNNLCVHVLDSEGNFKFKFGREGSDESQLKGPWGICVDGMGNIIVADYDKKPYSDYMYLERRRAPPDNGCVKMFDSRGRFLCNIVSGMKTPCGVAVSPGGDVVVTDIVDCSVSIWTQA